MVEEKTSRLRKAAAPDETCNDDGEDVGGWAVHDTGPVESGTQREEVVELTFSFGTHFGGEGCRAAGRSWVASRYLTPRPRV